MENSWMVRAGEGGYLFSEFAKGFVAIGWNEFGDMSKVRDIEETRKQYIKAYPETKAGAVANQVSMFYKFLNVMKVNDNVITFDPNSREYLVGTIISDYYYKSGEVKDYPHVRKVKWSGRITRDSLSASSRNSLGSTLTLMSINDDVWGEIVNALKGQSKATSAEAVAEEKKDLQQIKEDTIERAHELIKDKILQLDDREMEHLVAAILRSMGYKTRVTPIGPDRGVDVLASPDGLGLENPLIKAEVKHRPKTQMGAQEVRKFIACLREGNRGLYVSTGSFSKEAHYEAERATIPVTLVDLDELAKLVVVNYDKFDLEGNTLIPLVRIYWPAE
jgi:restriction system protein